MGYVQGIEETDLEEICKNVVDHIQDWLIVYDKDGDIVYVNKYVEIMLGEEYASLIGNQMFQLWQITPYNITLREKINFTIESGRDFDTIFYLKRKNGEPFYLAVTLKGIKDENGDIKYYSCIGKDITSTKMLQEKFHKIKYIEEITSLPNQTAFIELVYNKISREQEKKFAIILLDIARMSYINTTYGLAAGDTVIKEMGERLEGCLKNRGSVCKLNSDVFAIVQEYDVSEASTTALVEEIFKILEKPFIIPNHELYVEIKAGVAFYPAHGQSAGKVISKAQMTLAKAKEHQGKNQMMIYTNCMEEQIQQRMLLENDMHKALENKEFIMYYQPCVELATNRCVGMEALLRRKKVTGEIVLPSGFIELLEQMELIEQVGLNIVEEVSCQIREWLDQGLDVKPVGINISSIQFKNDYLAEDIMKILNKYQVPTALIIIEITETVVMSNIERSRRIVNKLKHYGFSIAIDDFGTGYSSLGYLRRFEFDYLKIDISFIREIAENPQDHAIVAAIISIAKALNLKTIAEGIETEAQLKIMQELGCEEGQGYFWDAPMKPYNMTYKYLVK